MTNRKISELPEAALPLKDTDLIPIVQDTDEGKMTVKAKFADIKGVPWHDINEAIDLNEFTATGMYECAGNQSHTNTPISVTGSFSFIVFRSDGGGSGYDTVMQMLVYHDEVYMRYITNSEWNEWKQIGQTPDLDNYVTLDTEQTITGAKVFTQYCNFKGGAGNDGSDMRFKTDIAPLGDVLDKVMKLDVINYHWNKKGEERDTFGLNATQVKEYFPRICHTRDDKDKTEWLEYDRFGVIALKAIQELASKVKKLEQEISILKNQRNG